MTADERDSPTETEPEPARATWRTAANILGVLILVALVVPFVVYAVPGVVGADASYVVLSGSMEPAMSPGDVIVVEAVQPERIDRGDVVTFRRSGEDRPTTHRVVEVVETEQGLAFRTAGDANEGPDPSLVAAEQVVGEVMTVGGYLFVIPLMGYVVQFAGTTMGILTLIVAPLALLVLSEAYVLARSTRGGDDTTTDGTTDDTAATGADAPDDQPGPPAGRDGVAEGGGAGAAAAEGETSAETDEAAGGITLTPKDLRLTVGVLFLFTAYAIWVAYMTREVWSVTAATTVSATFVLVGAMYLFGGSPPDEDADRPGDEATGTAAEPPAEPSPRPSSRRPAVVRDGGAEQAVTRVASAGTDEPEAVTRNAGAGAPRLESDTATGADSPDGGAPGAVAPDPPTPRPAAAESDLTPAVMLAESDPAPAVPPAESDLTPAVTPTDESTDIGPPVDDEAAGGESGASTGTSTGAADAPDDAAAADTAAIEATADEATDAVVEATTVEATDAVVEATTVEATDAVVEATAGEATGGGNEGDRGGARPPSSNPLIAVPFVLLYYVGYVVVEPIRFVYHRLPLVGGGGSDA